MENVVPAGELIPACEEILKQVYRAGTIEQTALRSESVNGEWKWNSV